MKKNILKLCFAIIGLIVFSSKANAAILNFDNFTNDEHYQLLDNSSYGGFEWNNMAVMNKNFFKNSFFIKFIYTMV